MKKVLLFALLAFTFAIFSPFSVSAQQNRTGNVELVEIDEDSGLLTFSVEGFASRKSDVIISAKETLFYKLLYTGVEGVNDGKKHIVHEKKYWLENFFEGKNAPYNAIIEGIEQEGAINKTTDGYYGTFNIIIKYKAFLRALRLNGIIDKETPVSPTEEAATPSSTAERTTDVVATLPAPEASGADNNKNGDKKTVLFTKEGVGPVKIGANPSVKGYLNRCTLPDSYEGLYDSISCDRNQFSGAFEIWGNLSDRTALEVLCDENDKIKGVSVCSPYVVTQSGFSINSDAASLLNAGAKQDAVWLKENGKKTEILYYYLMLDGLYFIFKTQDVPDGVINRSAHPQFISNRDVFGDAMSIAMYSLNE